jgi:hypothetical protein
MTRKCIAWGSEPFLKSVKSLATSGKATQMLLKHPSYSRFYRLYLQFQQELKINLDTEQYLTTLTLRKMWDLYQIWSVFHISKMIVDILTDADYQVTSNSIFYEVEKDSFQIDVRKNMPTVTLAKEDLRIQMKKEDDLGKMRIYRDKICYKTYDPRKPDQRPQKVVSSAYIIYPGTYLEHDPDEAEIGALPLVPDMAQEDMLEVEEAIKDILWYIKLL